MDRVIRIGFIAGNCCLLRAAPSFHLTRFHASSPRKAHMPPRRSSSHSRWRTGKSRRNGRTALRKVSRTFDRSDHLDCISCFSLVREIHAYASSSNARSSPKALPPRSRVEQSGGFVKAFVWLLVL